ncbi:MAG: pseudouridine synthase [Pseudomonadales bacterium]|nr:pseudouridine synthase [Pseudomonadales bacterium]NNM12416.1 pseudouridine synthase [Pseudomonadales bacterium]
MPQLLLFNKPYLVLSQFTEPTGPAGKTAKQTLAGFIDAPGFYAAGRLDYHSEGLLLLTNNGKLQARIASPENKVWKHYWAQVEGDATETALQPLRDGIELKDGPTKPARVSRLAHSPAPWPRTPAVSPSRAARSSWLDIAIYEGRNRQVRRMCAAIGLPVLRLVRYRIGDWQIGELQPGQQRRINIPMPDSVKTPNIAAGKSRGPSKTSRRH